MAVSFASGASIMNEEWSREKYLKEIQQMRDLLAHQNSIFQVQQISQNWLWSFFQNTESPFQKQSGTISAGNQQENNSSTTSQRNPRRLESTLHPENSYSHLLLMKEYSLPIQIFTYLTPALDT